MRVYIGPYISRWISSLDDRWMKFRYKDDYHNVEEDQLTRLDKFVIWIDGRLQLLYNATINRYLDNKKRKIKVKIHDYDVWSADDTLARIILPTLTLLKEKKHGAPNVEYDDLPPEMRPSLEELAAYHNNGTTDEMFFERWDYVLDAMIWSFTEICNDDAEDSFYNGESSKFDHEGWDKYNKRVQYGLTMFGKYYRSLWD